MVGRDNKGRFKKGEYSGGPGRPKKSQEDQYFDIMLSACTVDDWRAICVKAVEQAKRGNPVARKWLSDYIIGPPVERKEVTGAGGGPLLVVNWDEPKSID